MKQKIHILGLAGAGFLASLLTLHPPARPLLVESGLELYLGVFFGIALAAYFWVVLRQRTLWKAACVISAAIVAYWASFFTTVWAYGHFFARFRSPQDYLNPPSYVMFIGGTVGAFLVCATVLTLYFPRTDRLWQRILYCTVGGGLLGVIAYGVGSVAGHSGPKTPDPTIAAWPWLVVMWQTGVGAVLGAILPDIPNHAEISQYPSILRTAPTKPEAPSGRGVSVGGKVFIFCIIAALVWLIGSNAWMRYRMGRYRRQLAAYQAERPSLWGLPPVQPKADDQALVLHAIAGRSVIPGGHRKYAASLAPERVEYNACYVGEPLVFCDFTAVQVQVRQYPNARWAEYEMNGLPIARGNGIEFPPATRITTFGKPILAIIDRKRPERGEYYWVSDNVLVVIKSNTSDPDEVIREYLARYPSSL